VQLNDKRKRRDGVVGVLALEDKEEML